MIFDFPVLQLAMTIVAFVSTILGLVIGYQAYRGFRRNDNRSMRQLSLGLILLTAVPYTISFTGTLLIRLEFVPVSTQTPIGFTARVIQLLGLAFITYSLYARS